MRKATRGVLLWLCLLGPGAAAGEAAPPAALRVMDDFLAAFNAQDVPAWADTLHFPHVRLAGGGVSVYPTREEFIAATDLGPLVAAGWHHSTWDSLDVVHAGATKVHIAVEFSRFDAGGRRLATYRSLYVVENVGGRWGVRARSSFAP